MEVLIADGGGAWDLARYGFDGKPRSQSETGPMCNVKEPTKRKLERSSDYKGTGAIGHHNKNGRQPLDVARSDGPWSWENDVAKLAGLKELGTSVERHDEAQWDYKAEDVVRHRETIGLETVRWRRTSTAGGAMERQNHGHAFSISILWPCALDIAAPFVIPLNTHTYIDVGLGFLAHIKFPSLDNDWARLNLYFKGSTQLIQLSSEPHCGSSFSLMHLCGLN